MAVLPSFLGHHLFCPIFFRGSLVLLARGVSCKWFLLSHNGVHILILRIQTMPFKTYREQGHDAIHSVSSPSETGTTYSVRQLLAIPIVHALCVSAFALSFLSAAFDVLFVLFCYSPILSGGLAFSVCYYSLCSCR